MIAKVTLCERKSDCAIWIHLDGWLVKVTQLPRAKLCSANAVVCSSPGRALAHVVAVQKPCACVFSFPHVTFGIVHRQFCRPKNLFLVEREEEEVGQAMGGSSPPQKKKKKKKKAQKTEKKIIQTPKKKIKLKFD